MSSYDSGWDLWMGRISGWVQAGVIAAGLCTPAAAEVKLKTVLATSDDGPEKSVYLSFYDGSCESADECIVAGFRCDLAGSAYVSIDTLSDADLAIWFGGRAKAARLSGGGATVDLHVASLTFTEMYGDWVMEARAEAVSDPAWQNFVKAKVLRLQFGKTDMKLPVTADLGKFLTGCAALK